MLSCPLGDFQRQQQAFRIEVTKENERVDRLGTALDVDRLGLMAIVPGSPSGRKKVFFQYS
jgi:hypothetical protein